jgi:phosphate-selective porin OprO/OprP
VPRETGNGAPSSSGGNVVRVQDAYLSGKEPTVMFKRLWRRWGRILVAGGIAAALYGGVARADDPSDVKTLKQQLESQKQQMEQQQQLLEQLKKKVAAVKDAAAPPATTNAAADGLPPLPDRDTVDKMVGDYLKRRDDERKAQEAAAKAQAEAEGYKVGTDLKMSGRWNPASGLTFETPNKDFVSHFGFLLQYDNVWFNQSPTLRPQSQLGDLQDGAFFRRIRPTWDGTAWEIMEWNVALAMEQNVNNVTNWDEIWAGLMNLPIIGSVRVGRMRVPQGLEAPNYVNAKPMTFLEQSAYAEAFYEKVAPGVWTSNSVLDQRATWAFMWYRQDEYNGSPADFNQSGVSFVDGKYAYTGRVTALPIYENDGRCLLHLGVSASWRKAVFVPATGNAQGDTGGPTFVEYRAHPLLRDAIGAYGSGNLPGNNARLVDTGMVDASSSTVIGTELLYIRGPFSLQAEYGVASMNNAYFPDKKGNLHRIETPWFNGGYAQLSYFLTGENRQYDRRLGALSRNYVQGGPYTPFWLTRGEDDKWLFGRGAWELAFRYNHLDLNDGPILGGKTDAFEVGINWHLNNNFRIMCEYLHQFRFDKQTAPGGILGGNVDGLGIRTQIGF